MHTKAAAALTIAVVVGSCAGFVPDGPTAMAQSTTLNGSESTPLTTPEASDHMSTSPTSTSPASATSTTAASTADTSTTAAPSTTLDASAAEEAAVSAAAVAARTARLDALTDPDDSDAIAALDGYYTEGGEARAEIDGRIQALDDNGYAVRPNPDVPDALLVEDVALLDGPPATRAEVTACVVDSAVTFQPGPAPEATDVVVSDDFRAFRTVYSLENDAGTWKVETAAFVDEWPGETTCPAPPPTSTAPPTTVDPVAAEEAAVAEAVREIQVVRMNAYVNLDAPGNVEALDASYVDGGVARAVVESDLQALRDEGWRVRENTTIPMTITVESVTLLDGPPATRANALVCLIDTGVVYEPGGAPDGSDVVVNDEIVAGRSIHHLVLDDGDWQLDEVETLNEWPATPECPNA